MNLKIFLPKFWLLNYPYDEEIDNFYKEIINHRRELKFFRSSEYELVLNTRDISITFGLPINITVI